MYIVSQRVSVHSGRLAAGAPTHCGLALNPRYVRFLIVSAAGEGVAPSPTRPSPGSSLPLNSLILFRQPLGTPLAAVTTSCLMDFFSSFYVCFLFFSFSAAGEGVTPSSTQPSPRTPFYSRFCRISVNQLPSLCSFSCIFFSAAGKGVAPSSTRPRDGGR